MLELAADDALLPPALARDALVLLVEALRVPAEDADRLADARDLARAFRFQRARQVTLGERIERADRPLQRLERVAQEDVDAGEDDEAGERDAEEAEPLHPLARLAAAGDVAQGEEGAGGAAADVDQRHRRGVVVAVADVDEGRLARASRQSGLRQRPQLPVGAGGVAAARGEEVGRLADVGRQRLERTRGVDCDAEGADHPAAHRDRPHRDDDEAVRRFLPQPRNGPLAGRERCDVARVDQRARAEEGGVGADEVGREVHHLHRQAAGDGGGTADDTGDAVT